MIDALSHYIRVPALELAPSLVYQAYLKVLICGYPFWYALVWFCVAVCK